MKSLCVFAALVAVASAGIHAGHGSIVGPSGAIHAGVVSPGHIALGGHGLGLGLGGLGAGAGLIAGGHGLIGSGIEGQVGLIGSGIEGQVGLVGSGIEGQVGLIGSGIEGQVGLIGSGLEGQWVPDINEHLHDDGSYRPGLHDLGLH